MFVMCGIFAIYKWGIRFKEMFYIHKDYLGSFETVTDGSGQVREKLSFDPWGRRRNPENWTYYSTTTEPTYLFDRGYTGHEHLDVFGLINMNGRVYDPWLGRFLSPDPFVQNPTFSQSYNRYSYVLNNPLKYVDPSGYFFGQPLDFKLGRGAFAPLGTPFDMGDRGQINFYFNVFGNSGHSTGYETESTAQYDAGGNFTGYTQETKLVSRDGNGEVINSEGVSNKSKGQDQGTFVGTAYYIVTQKGKIIYVGFADAGGNHLVTNVVLNGDNIVLGEFIFSDGGNGQAGGGDVSFWDAALLAWDSKIIGRDFPDLISFDITLSSTAVAGASMTYAVNFYTRGERGVNVTATEQNRFIGEVDWGLNLNIGYYQGNPLNITQSSVAGPVESISAGAFGYSGQGYFGYNTQGDLRWIGGGMGLGFSWGASYGSGRTRIIWP